MTFTPEEITAMAKEAGIEFEMQQALFGGQMLFTDGSLSVDRMARFAAVISAKVQEACAQLCDATVMQSVLNSYDAGWAGGAETCADRIRSRASKVEA
jgi:hypothetical protein